MIPKSKEVRFETTTKCMYSCITCPRKKFTRKIETMSLKDFRNLFCKINQSTDQYNTVTFSGFGEPLLDTTLAEKMKFAKEFNYKIILLTNGYLLKPKKFEELKEAGLDIVRMSIYGANESTYKKVHRYNGFRQVFNNLIYIHNNKEHLKVGISYLSIKGVNDNEIVSWKWLFESLANEIDIWRPHDWAGLENFREIKKQKDTCGRLNYGPLQIQVDGTVNACCFDVNGFTSFGDLHKNNLDEIFRSDDFHNIYIQHQTGKFTNKKLPCMNCDQRNKDKDNTLIYTSRGTFEDRINKTSTSLENLS